MATNADMEANRIVTRRDDRSKFLLLIRDGLTQEVNDPRFLKMLWLKTVPIARMAPLAAVLVVMQVVSEISSCVDLHQFN